MLKFLRSFALAAAMLLPFAAQAQPQSWTVADGTDVIAGVPLDFYNTDGSGNMQAQMLYPASLLSSMDGATIGELTFYHQSTNSKTVSASTWYIRLGETTATSLSEGFSSETLTTVYSGSITFASGVLSIELTTPYTYGGGNLIVEIQTSGANGNWYGSNGQGLYGTNGIGSTYSTMSTPNHNTFLPKVVFTEAPSCFPVTGLAIDAEQTTTSSLTFTWTDANNTGASYDIYTVTATDTTFLTNVASTTYTATGLEANTSYTFAVAANCGATDGLAEKVFVSGRTACAAIAPCPTPWASRKATCRAPAMFSASPSAGPASITSPPATTTTLTPTTTAAPAPVAATFISMPPTGAPMPTPPASSCPSSTSLPIP